MNKNYLLIFSWCFLVLGAQLKAQSVSGTVVDENNDPLPGVAVVLKGTSLGAATDFEGKYFISDFKEGTITLNFSFIGYQDISKTLKVSSGEKVSLNISMKPSTQNLDEVIVVGYGVKRRRDVTNSIVSLETKDITDLPTPSFENGIQGKASGVQVITGSGIAGSGSVVKIRGAASVSAGGDPLYVVDGVPITQDPFLNGNRGGFNTNPLASINPNDIESIEILKDAAAAGIYGSRGANGVILITTKRGQKGKVRYSFSARVGASRPTALPDMLNSKQYLQLYEESWVNDGNVGTPILPGSRVSWAEAQNINTDWIDQTVRTGIKQKYDFSASSGTDRINWFASFSYQNDDSYLEGNSYNKLNGRANIDYKVSDRFDIGFTTSLGYAQNYRVDAAWAGGLGAAMSTALPIYPITWDRDTTDGNGNTHKKGDYWLAGGINNNPVAQRELKDWVARELRTINNVTLTYKPSEKSYIRFLGGFDYMDFEDDIFEKPGYDESHVVDSTGRRKGRAFLYPIDVLSANGNLTYTYLWDMNDDNHFTFLAGTEYQYSRTIKGDGYENQDATASISESNEWSNTPSDRIDEWGLASLFGRVNYNYKGKYYAEGLLRTDGSSKFGDNYKYGFFPAVSAGWIVTEEDFFSSSWLTFWKIKASYGKSGNSNLPNYQTFNEYQRSNDGYNGEPYIYPIRRNNPNLRWESVRTFDVAMEFGMWNDRLTGEVSFYNKQTNDMLLNVQLQKSTGFANWWDNVGSAFNRGIELRLRSRNIVNGDFTWETDFNIARNYNEITSIGNYTEDAVGGGTNDTRVVVGSPIGTNFLVRFSHVDPTTGRPVYLDKDGNQTMSWDPVDRVAVGAVSPDAFGGINNIFHFRNWDMNFLFVYTIGGNIYDSSSKRQLGVVTDWNMREELYDRWRAEGDQTKYPRLTQDTEVYGSGTEWINTDQWIHDASYVRLRNVSVSYNFTPQQLEKMHLSSFRLTANVTNIWTWKNSIVLDPEIARDFDNATDRNMSPNITYLTPPQEMTFNLGIQVGF